MKRIVLFLLVFICFSSCKKDEYASNLKIMGEKAKQKLADEVFKGNGTVIFLEFAPISYDTITENKLDTLRLLKINDKISKLIELAHTRNDLLKSKVNEYKIYKSAGMDDLAEMTKDEFNEANSDFQRDMDKMKEYNKQDSIIRSDIEKRTNQQSFYHLKFFVKATITDNSTQKTSNQMDTMYIIFDSQLNVVEPDNF